MISQSQLRKVADRARDSWCLYVANRCQPLEPRDLFVDQQSCDHRKNMATDFAQCAASTPVYPFQSLPEPGFASWLLSLPVPAIAIDRDQLAAWSRKTGLAEDVQWARAIFHEVGHIKMQPNLLKKPNPQAHPFIQSADPQDENDAWVFAAVVLGIALGEYSEHQKQNQNQDDSPSIPI